MRRFYKYVVGRLKNQSVPILEVVCPGDVIRLTILKNKNKLKMSEKEQLHLLDKSKIYRAYSLDVVYDTKVLSKPLSRWQRIKIIFEDDKCYFVESVDENPAEFGKKFWLQKKQYILGPIPKSTVVPKIKSEFLDKNKIYAGYPNKYSNSAFNNTNSFRKQICNHKWRRVHILFEDDISWYVESLDDKDAKGFGKRYSIKKHCFALKEVKPSLGVNNKILESKSQYSPFFTIKDGILIGYGGKPCFNDRLAPDTIIINGILWYKSTLPYYTKSANI